MVCGVQLNRSIAVFFRENSIDHSVCKYFTHCLYVSLRLIRKCHLCHRNFLDLLVKEYSFFRFTNRSSHTKLFTLEEYANLHSR